MGREKANKPRKQRDWRDETSSAEGNPGIWINSAPRKPEGFAQDKPAACILTWGELEWYAPVEDVVRTAEDLSTAAAYADMVGELMHVGLDGAVIGGFLESLLGRAFSDREPVHGGMMGADSTLGVMPAGSTARKAGVVILRRGALSGGVSPDGARKMARHWIEAASGAVLDELVLAVAEDMLGVRGTEKVQHLMGYLAALRERSAPDREAFREEEAARLRLMLGGEDR